VATITDFTLRSSEDGTLIIAAAPPMPIGGLSFQFTQSRRAGGIPAITLSMASGYYGSVSGMDLIDSGNGVMSVSLWAYLSSGMDQVAGAWFYRVQRTDSGNVTAVSEGYRLMPP
jgi:hypothetical protein